MRLADGKQKLGKWMPDLPDLDNPGLTDAKNVIPVPGGYAPFRPLSTPRLNAHDARVKGAFSTVHESGGAGSWYAGTTENLYLGALDRSGATYTTQSGGFWRFAEYKGLIIATNASDPPQGYPIGGLFDDLATSGTAPDAVHVGTIGQFVVLGNLPPSDKYSIQWSAIDNAQDWPTPGSADALSKQSGKQDFDEEYGQITAIAGGDQYGLIFQGSGITRMTYIGGDEVFQFDQYAFGIGATYHNATIQQGGYTYFISKAGFYRTDGTKMEPIGAGIVDRYFRSTAGIYAHLFCYAGVDLVNHCIYWIYPVSTDFVASKVLIFNYDTGEWSYAEADIECLVSDELGIHGYTTAHRVCDFDGTPGTAVLTTAEVEFNPGGRTHVQGVKPLVSHTSSVTATVALGTREEQDDAVTYTSEVSPHSRTGFCGSRSDSRFHRARLTITGDFGKAMGLQFQQVPSGAV